MPCLLIVLIAAFPRLGIVLLYLFTNFFRGVYSSLLIPILGFLFLPITLIVYTYFLNTHTHLDVMQFIILFVAVVLDLGLLHPSARRRSN
jgi:hypothetical protein